MVISSQAVNQEILSPAPHANQSALVDEALSHVSHLDFPDAAAYLETIDSLIAAAVLRRIAPQAVESIIGFLPPDPKSKIFENIPQELQTQWQRNSTFPEDSIGRMMDPAIAVFSPDVTVAEAIESLRELVKREFVTYGYVVDFEHRLIGVIVMRDLLFAAPQISVRDIMLTNPFSLKAEALLMDAMREVLHLHYPVYPVCDAQGILLGLVRGHRLFEAQTVEISAQAGSMVGVEKEERLSTSWGRSFRYRHPWLQLNLITAFVAGAVVSLYQETIDQMVILAAFLPILAGQSGNTGCQALAVTLRGLTLGELKKLNVKKVLIKEGLLGLLNGFAVGLVAAAGMYFLARSQGNENAAALGAIVLLAMVGSCMISGICGAIVPLVLKRLGADPATASSIFLTTATDVASMGMLLALATFVLL